MFAQQQKPQVVVITGASAGVGRACAQEFARHGAHIALVARGRTGLNATRREVEQLGGKALVIPTDVADADRVEAAAMLTEMELGPIDVWVNNAMASVFAPFKDLSPKEFKRVTEVTYLGTVYGTKAALKRMLPRNRGTIVQVGSALAYRSIPLQSAYCGAKHAMKGFTASLRSELIHDGSDVHVTMVQLPALNTPQFGWTRNKLTEKSQPVPPIFQPEVAARAIYYASQHKRREIQVGGSTLKAIVGNKVMAGALDHYLARNAYEGQQTGEPNEPGRRDNLWEPLPVDAGAHGRFDDTAREQSVQAWMNLHRGWIAAAGVGLAGGAAALLRQRSAA